MLERRLAMGERALPTNDAGLVLGDDGVVYEVASDGTRTALGNGDFNSAIALTGWHSPRPSECKCLAREK